MKKRNQILLIAAVLLFVLSAMSYRNTIERADRFQRGQKLLPNLNPDAIAKITVRQNEEETVLRRDADGERFVVVSADGYRAQNAAVNRFVRDALGIGLEKEIGAGEDHAADLGLEPGGEETVEVVFENDAGKEMVRFLVGDRQEDGGGQFVRRIGGGEDVVFLAASSVFLSTDVDAFLDKEILDVPRPEVQAIRGADFAFERPEEGGELALVDLGEAETASSQASQVQGVLSGLRFTEHHLANAPEVADLLFEHWLEVELTDGSGYRLEVAQRGEDHFLRAQGFHTAERVTIARDASEEEVRETSEILERVDEIEAWNAFHGSWIYEVSDLVAERVAVRRADLVE